MKSSELIEKLLDDEELPPVEEAIGLPLIRAPEELAELEQKKSDGGMDKREFSRIDIREKQLALKFANESQFARQYIENISIGGLFVKTDLKPAMGSFMPIEFSIPQEEGEKVFRLKARVCRVAEAGVGLEFTNLSPEVRQDLEKFVLSILPEGVGLTARAKKSTIERLESLREARLDADKKLKSISLKLLFVAVLIGANIWMINDIHELKTIESHAADTRIHLSDKEIDVHELQSVSRSQDGTLHFFLADGTSVETRGAEIEKQLPYQLRQTIHLLSSIPALKQPRVSKTEDRIPLQR
jgi:uncharacterized protein (TIGR02266 family)